MVLHEIIRHVQDSLKAGGVRAGIEAVDVRVQNKVLGYDPEPLELELKILVYGVVPPKKKIVTCCLCGGGSDSVFVPCGTDANGDPMRAHALCSRLWEAANK